MRMQTTNYFLLCVVMLLGIGNIQAQDTVMTKVKTTSLAKVIKYKVLTHTELLYHSVVLFV